MKIDIKPLKNNRTELYQWDTDRQTDRHTYRLANLWIGGAI